MALLFIDGFDHYATADLAKKWPTGGGSAVISATGGRRNGGMLVATISLVTNVVRTFTPTASVVVGFAFLWSGSFSGTGPTLVSFLDSGSQQVELRMNTDGTLYVARNGTLIASSSVAMASNVYNYIEFKVTIATSIGANTCKVRANSVEVINVAAGSNLKTTANSSVNAVRIGGASNTNGVGQMQYDDFYVCDSTGSVNNDFLGDCRVDTLYPNADGAYSGLTPSTGSAHWSTVDDATPNTTDYVSSSTVNAKDSYAFTDVSAATTVYGVQISNACLKDDAGARSVANLVRSGGTDVQSATVTLTTGQQYVSSVHELNPATGTAWTQSTVNAAEFGTVVAA